MSSIASSPLSSALTPQGIEWGECRLRIEYAPQSIGAVAAQVVVSGPFDQMAFVRRGFSGGSCAGTFTFSLSTGALNTALELLGIETRVDDAQVGDLAVAAKERRESGGERWALS